MYHGDKVPGFPQHPHRGFETITATITGVIDHTDSLGNAGRYGVGDLQWMTAGEGVVHGEMFPLVNTDAPNPCRFFQIWLNLPGRDKMAKPSFVMHWAPDVPKVSQDGGKAEVTVWAGKVFGAEPGAPPPHSWASAEENDVAVWRVVIEVGGQVVLPLAAGGRRVNRVAYFYEGESLHVAGKSIGAKTRMVLDASQESCLRNTGKDRAEVLILQGKPINEPVAQRGPFVMNTQQEISQAFQDYSRTQFGGWPWPDDAMVFPPTQQRFAKMDGATSYPPP